MSKDTPEQNSESTSAAQAATQDQISAEQGRDTGAMLTVLTNIDLMSVVFDNFTDKELMAYRSVSKGFKHKIDRILLQRLFDGRLFCDVWNEADGNKKVEIARLMKLAKCKPGFEKDITALENIAYQYLEVIEINRVKRRNVNPNLLKTLSPFMPFERNGSISLSIAAQFGYLDLVNILLSRGANVNAQDKEGMTALHLAAESGHTDVVKTLLKSGANVNAQAKSGKTALHMASIYGHVEIVKLLITAGAFVNDQDANGFTALHFAAYWGMKDVVEALLHRGADPNALNSDKGGVTPLYYAAAYNYIELTEVMLNRGADINCGKVSPLCAAACQREGIIWDMLTRKDPDFSVLSQSGELLHKAYAAYFYNLSDSSGMDYGEIGTADIHMLMDVINRVDVNSKDYTGNTVLHYALEDYIEENNDEIKCCLWEIVLYLMYKSAKINIANDNGVTARMMVAVSDDDALKQLFLGCRDDENVDNVDNVDESNSSDGSNKRLNEDDSEKDEWKSNKRPRC